METQFRLSYRGKWQNGLWHGIGDFFETFQTKNMKITIQIQNGLFINGKLTSGESHSDAHITINKRINDSKILEIHLYGQMKENESKKILKFLEDALFSRNFYFHSDKSRKTFQKYSQIHMIGNHLDKKGYELVGHWINDDENNYKFGNLLKNEFEDKKKRLVHELKNEIFNSILKCGEYTRYSILCFYIKIAKSELKLEELLDLIKSETDEKVCTKSIKTVVNNLEVLIELENECELKKNLPINKYDTTSLEIKNQFEHFIQYDYIDWLKSLNSIDINALNLSVNNILLVDPSILKTVFELRIIISSFLLINEDFELIEHDCTDSGILSLFNRSWFSYFTNEQSLRKLMKMECSMYFVYGWMEFCMHAEKIKDACALYKTYFSDLLSIFNDKIILRQTNNEYLNNTVELFVNKYKELLKYEFLLESNDIVDLKQKHDMIIEEIVNEKLKPFFEIIELETSILVEEIKLKREDNYTFLKELIIFSLNRESFLKKFCLLDKALKTQTKQQLRFMIYLYSNNHLNITELKEYFYLEEIFLTIKQWQRFADFELIKSSLDEISRLVLLNNEFSMSAPMEIFNKEVLEDITALISQQKNFVKKIENLPLYLEKNEMNEEMIFQYSDKSSLKHSSYDVIANVLNIMEFLIYKLKKIDFAKTVKISIKFYDSLSVLIDEFPEQLNIDYLEEFFEQKIKFFEELNDCDIDDVLEKLSS
ncbi:unnamed protein product [Brachionus calyciflorus]|uniref:Uncharacterized protein n=1 Tax=Brachionus calyciflorus TaxID=104777 RepID=A0A814P1C0_9BILA|nr:unnamed protein product [Brachionus calyciflorus]